MIAKIRNYFRGSQRRYQMIKDGRTLLEALEGKEKPKTDFEVLEVMLKVALSHLRAVKASMDATRAAQEMDRRIKEGPRPTREEAQLN